MNRATIVAKTLGPIEIAVERGVDIPLAFFIQVFPRITDIAELQVTLSVIKLVYAAGGFAHPIAEQAIFRDRPLREALRLEGSPSEPDRRIGIGLDLAVGRGSLLKIVAERHGERTVWYYVHTAENQARVAAMGRGSAVPPSELWTAGEPPVVQPERPTVFRLYEQNIGILTPLIAERLVDAIETYPLEWIEDAISEAVSYNRRSWRYINRILENWAVAGRGDRASEGGSNEAYRGSNAGHLDPDQYKHGHYLDRTRKR